MPHHANVRGLGVDPTIRERGATLPDRRINSEPPNIRVVWHVDEAAFKDRLYTACSDN